MLGLAVIRDSHNLKIEFAIQWKPNTICLSPSIAFPLRPPRPLR